MLHRGIYLASTGRKFACAGFTDRDAIWPWIIERVAEWFAIAPDAIQLVDDDLIAAYGEIIAVVRDGDRVNSPLPLDPLTLAAIGASHAS